jgi:hypothetical protein
MLNAENNSVFQQMFHLPSSGYVMVAYFSKLYIGQAIGELDI